MINITKRTEELSRMVDYGISEKERRTYIKELNDMETILSWIKYQCDHLYEGTYDSETREVKFVMKNTTRFHFKTLNFSLMASSSEREIPITLSDWKPRETKTISFFHNFNDDWSYKTRNVLTIKSRVESIEYELFDKNANKNTGLKEGETRKLVKSYSQIQGQLVVLRLFCETVPDYDMRAKARKIEDLAIKIYDRVHEKPELRSQASRFFSVYLPTICKTLDNYEKMLKTDVKGPNADQMRDNVNDMLNTTVIAFSKLRDKLYDSTVLGGSVDSDVMKQLMQQEGLL